MFACLCRNTIFTKYTFIMFLLFFHELIPGGKVSFCVKLAFKYATDEWFLFFMNSISSNNMFGQTTFFRKLNLTCFTCS